MKKIYISAQANTMLCQYLKSLGFELVTMGQLGITYSPVDTHTDIFCCRMGAGRNADVFIGGKSEIGHNYPDNVKFNALCLGRYFIHNLKYTSPALLNEARKNGLTLINVKQGYTKCNVLPIDDNSAITSDEGIYRTLSSLHDIDVLKIRTGYVKLSGFDYGFIGGASGRVDNEIIFNGDISAHPDFNIMRDFIEARGLSVKYFTQYPLTDIGSIISE